MSISTVKFTETDHMDQPASAIGWIDTFILMFPRWKRSTVAFVVSVAAALLTGYVVGTVFSSLIIGAYALTGSMFLVWMLFILMYLAAIYLGSKAAKFAKDIVMDDAVGKKMEAIASSAKNKVTGWFSKSKVTS
jgi:hypothetical protein